MTTQRFFEGKFNGTDQSQTQQASRQSVDDLARTMRALSEPRQPSVMDAFYSSEGFRKFRGSRAHVISCAMGGYGVVEFTARGMTRHGYTERTPCRGAYTHSEATMLVDQLNAWKP